MVTNSRRRAKGRRPSGTFCALPHHVFRSEPGKPAPAAALSKTALALLVDMAAQFNGSNNGNLSAAPKIMAAYGWHSQGTLTDALVEVVAFGFLTPTRQGGRNQCSLYALAWHGIDEGPHDTAPNPVPSRLWLSEQAHLRDPAFVRRWKEAQQRRRGKNTSRYSDKPSRYSDKSEAFSRFGFPLFGHLLRYTRQEGAAEGSAKGARTVVDVWRGRDWRSKLHRGAAVEMRNSAC